MLAVTIELDVNVIAMLACVEVPRLNGAPYAEVAREVYDVEPMLSAQRERSVPGPIVHDNIVVSGAHDALDDREKGLLLVIGRYDDEGLRCDSFNDASTARILAVRSVSVLPCLELVFLAARLEWTYAVKACSHYF